MHILVVDDDDICRQIIHAILERLGHRVSATTNGDAAWELLLADGADVIISDWHMPGLNGLELCERARRQPGLPYPYFILLTAYGEHRDVLAAMQSGVDDHLTKPPTLESIEYKLVAAARVTALHAELATRHRALTTANQELRENRSALQVANSTLERLARRDVVTGLGNRLAMNDAIADIQDRFDRYGHGFSVAMLDLDHFKSYNDTFGHQAGDLVLAAAGAGIALEIRPGDSAYRYGGEEFLIVYPNQTVATASTAVQRIRHRIERDSSRGDVAHSVTVSAGIAEARLGDHFDCVVRRADLALYQAKHDGRNQICAEPKNGSVTPE